MVRVTHPPGGAPKLECHETAGTKAVRVLKPPGGHSSISFGEEDNSASVPSKTKVPAAEEAKQESPAADTAPAEEPVAPATPAEEAPAAAPAEAPESPKAAEKEQPESPKTSSPSNGTTNGSCKDSSSSNDEFPSVSFDSSNVELSNGEPCAAPEPELKTSNGVASEKSEPPASPPKENGSSTPVDRPAVNGKQHTNGVQTNGSSSPSSPTDVKPSKIVVDNSDNKPHVPRAMPSNHHMKSSIFMQEETVDYPTPPRRKDSGSSPVKEDKKQASPPQQAPPMRVRQPPGGFSTALW